MITFEPVEKADEVVGRLRPLFEKLPPHHLKHVYHVQVDGLPCALASLFMLHDGVGECMVEIIDYGFAEKRKTSFIRALIRMLRQTMKDEGLRRVQCTTRTDNLLAIRFVHTMGFHCEGILQKYGVDGADHAMFALYA